MSTVLGIETSCDETAVALVRDGHTILDSEVASQMDIHAVFGGVVPEVASRKHVEVLRGMCAAMLGRIGDAHVDAVAATAGPGLLGSLFVGLSFGKALAYGMGLPFVPVHHLEGHILSPFIDGEGARFPFIALIVSGGHTSLYHCRDIGDYETLGTTRDDAVGECFDKVARLLDLGYPGGPAVQRAADGGDTKAFDFPIGMAGSESLDFSYSGLKTAVLYAVRDNPGVESRDIAASFQAAAVDALVGKAMRAIKETNAPLLVVAGGVAANALLRERLTESSPVPVVMPPISLCTDNAAMIAAAACYRLDRGETGDLSATPDPNMPLA